MSQGQVLALGRVHDRTVDLWVPPRDFDLTTPDPNERRLS